jgi:hypothetical protein
MSEIATVNRGWEAYVNKSCRNDDSCTELLDDDEEDVGGAHVE